MPAIRQVKIKNFRGIASLEWSPHPGINAVIGPGDSGKSTILDAIDLVLGARRAAFTDADFHHGNVSEPIIIEVTVGDLPPALLSLEAYGLALRGWFDLADQVYDEPEDGTEPVLTLRLTVDANCEPSWCLYSDRLAASELPRDMRMEHRQLISAQRLGGNVAHHLTWAPRSVLARLSEGAAGSSEVLLAITRSVREEFAHSDIQPLQAVAALAQAVGKEMAVAGAEGAKAAVDPRAVSISSGAIALHSAADVPLRALGTGSSRLLAAGLQAKAAARVPVLLLDEIEHGLEPHRIMRLLHQLGSKEDSPRLQVFLTTHSPTALRELSASQIWLARRPSSASMTLKGLSSAGVEQGLLRSDSDAFLAKAVLVCEGATEFGLLRGVDISWTQRGIESFALLGIGLVDGKGVPNAYDKALAFADLGFPVAFLRDADKVDPAKEQALISAEVAIFTWDEQNATEDELFASLPLAALSLLLQIADSHHSSVKVDANLCMKKEAIAALRADIKDVHRPVLAAAARRGGWFKRVDFGEEVGRRVLEPNLGQAIGKLQETLTAVWNWTRNSGASCAS